MTLYTTYVSGFGPIAFYPLQETSGSISNDISGNNYNANIIGNISLGQTQTAFGTALQSSEYYSNYLFNTSGSGFVDIGNQINYTGSEFNVTNFGNSGISNGGYYLSGWITFWVRAIAPNQGGGMLVFINNVGLTVDNLGNIGFYQATSPSITGPIIFNICSSNIMDGQDHFVAFNYEKYYQYVGGAALGASDTSVQFYVTVIVDDLTINSGNSPSFSYGANTPNQESSMIQTDSSIGAYTDGTQPFSGYIKLLNLLPFDTAINFSNLFSLGYAYISHTNQSDNLLSLLDLNVSNRQFSSVLNAPLTNINNIEIITEIQQGLRTDFVKILENTGICPTPNAPIIIPIGYVYGSGAEFAPGNYYRLPVDTTMVIDNQIIPKYFNNFAYPISTFVYPSTSEYSGLMLVKSSAYNGVLPSDVIQLTGTQVITDLTTYVNEIFVF